MDMRVADDEASPQRRSEQYQKQLVALTAQGHAASFEKLVRLYQSRVRTYVQVFADKVNEQVDDLAQDVFLGVYTSAKHYRSKSTVGTWIFSIAKNTISNKLRKKKLIYYWALETLRKSDQDRPASLEPSIPHDGEFYLDLSQRTDLLRRALAALSTPHREILVLFEYSELSYHQVAEVIGISVGTVKSRLFNARKELAKQFREVS